MLLREVFPAAVQFIYCFSLGVLIPAAFVVFHWLCSPLKLLFPRFFERVSMVLYEHVLSNPPMWMQYLGRFQLWESGHDVSSLTDKRVLVVSNHQSTADVPFLFYAFCVKKEVLSHLMWVIDATFKWAPFGWVSQLHNDFFILQGKSVRTRQLETFAKHLKQFYLNYPRRWLVIFPEGGFLYKRRISSQAYARKNGHPHLQHVTLPRVGAVQTLLDVCSTPDSNNIASPTSGNECCIPHGLNPAIEYIVDVTIGYPFIDGEVKELDIGNVFMGTRAHSKVHMHYRVYSMKDVPTSSTYELTQWFYDRWYEKEQLLSHLYEHGAFPAPSESEQAGSIVPVHPTPQLCRLSLFQCITRNLFIIPLFCVVYYWVPLQLWALSQVLCDSICRMRSLF